MLGWNGGSRVSSLIDLSIDASAAFSQIPKRKSLKYSKLSACHRIRAREVVLTLRSGQCWVNVGQLCFLKVPEVAQTVPETLGSVSKQFGVVWEVFESPHP